MFNAFSDAWFRSWQLGYASAVTVAARMPVLAQAAICPAAGDEAELRRMVSEKSDAAIEGAAAAGAAMAGFAFAAARGAGPAELTRRGARLMDAAVAPSRRRARANARRLTRGA